MRRLRSEKAERAATGDARGSNIEVAAEVDLRNARLVMLGLDHPGPGEHMFFQEDIYWVDLCLTPRRPTARARYIDLWGSHRFHEMGPIIALPPGHRLHLESAGGRHTSLICQLPAQMVHDKLPAEFEWTDRHFEALLYIANDTIRDLLLRLVQEMRHPRIASGELCEAIVVQLGIELARHLLAINEPVRKGGLASWRLRTIEKRAAEPGAPPTLGELSELCNLSARQLTRGFRISRGYSIGDFLAQSRIEAAKRRLATSESVSQIADSLGYSSPSNFTASFRRATGFTPSEFRTRVMRSVRDMSTAHTGRA